MPDAPEITLEELISVLSKAHRQAVSDAERATDMVGAFNAAGVATGLATAIEIVRSHRTRQQGGEPIPIATTGSAPDA